MEDPIDAHHFPEAADKLRGEFLSVSHRRAWALRASVNRRDLVFSGGIGRSAVVCVPDSRCCLPGRRWLHAFELPADR